VIPLRDHNPTIRTPVVTWTLIAINVLVFLGEIGAGEAGARTWILRWGLIPAVVSSPEILVARSAGGAMGSLVTPLTSMFLHGGWLHLIGNMWFLHIFGDNVEDNLGRVRYLVFYLGCGLLAAATQVLVDPSSTTPMVGASGAISGVLAAYVLMHPHARVLTVIPIFIFLQFVEIPAFLFIFLWFGLQVLSGMVGLVGQGGTGAGVAWFAHIGGFIAGLALVRTLGAPYFARRARRPRWPAVS